MGSRLVIQPKRVNFYIARKRAKRRVVRKRVICTVDPDIIRQRVESCVPMVHALALEKALKLERRKGCYSTFPEVYDQCVSRGFEVLFAAARKYDESYRVKFSTYAYESIKLVLRSRGLDSRIGDAWSRHRLKYNAQVFSLDDGEFAARSGDFVASVANRDAFESILRWLPGHVRDVIELMYGQEWSSLEIGRHLGISTTRVRQIRDEAFEMIRYRWATNGVKRRKVLEGGSNQ